MARAFLAATLAVLAALQAWAQSTTDEPEFEVADIKVSTSKDAIPGKGGLLPGGRLNLTNATLRDFVVLAYGVYPGMVVGGPNWIDHDRYDVVAKAPRDSPISKLRLMLQTLLVERFHLSIHREDKTMPVYELVVGKNGPKLSRSPDPGPPSCGSRALDGGLERRECHNMTMPELALALPGWGRTAIDRPVMDSTGLVGVFDFEFDMDSRPHNDGATGDSSARMGDSGSTISEAMIQLGLKLELRKRPMSVIVIDHAERVPIAN